MTINFTTCLALDEKHLAEFRLTWPTWVKHRPEILSRPLKLLVDEKIFDGFRPCLQHQDVEIVPVPDDGTPQRDRMLSSLVQIAPWFVRTKWLLKLDVDAVAMKPHPEWCSEELVRESIDGEPVFVASGWNYTKPADAIQRLDDWADTVPELADKPRLNLLPSPGSDKVVTKGRVISYVFFGRVDWLRWAAGLCKRLPVCSHDSYLWYVAKRHGDYYRCRQQKQYGWDHVRRRKLAEMCERAMG